MDNAIPTGGSDVQTCHVCGDTIWEDRWPAHTDTRMKRDICSFCFSRLGQDRKYRPKVFSKSELAVCDQCGEISAVVQLTSAGWFCEDCQR